MSPLYNPAPVSGGAAAITVTPTTAEEWFPGEVATASFTTGASTADFGVMIINHAITVTHLFIRLSGGGTNVDVGIYDDDGASGAPATRLVSSGSIPYVAGAQAIAVAATTLQPGRYWRAIAVDTGTTAITGLQYDTNTPGLAMGTLRYTKTSSFPLPATVTSPVASGSGQVPAVIPGRK